MSKPTIDTCAEIFLNGEALIETIPDTYVAKSGLQGQGLFTSRAWARDEVLCVLDGQLVEAKRYPVLLTEMEWNALPGEMLLVRPLRTSYGFINHSFNPSIEIGADYRTMRAIRSIAAGEELTLDYAVQPVPDGYMQRDDTTFMQDDD
ncbi:SET domain-containing protein [Phyllobacterium sp. CL33Tsu]|uniref:SET domain-containing protein-lysine N-methyltransferase n=1 Tax=Phyllobacterium sp. CL33Tsu TaxID=1798191 RepID=UPI0008ECE244|nr:SET domain-containing protein [Phyllobacterium sp. CL33Tsu]SFI93238.1 SET domain-containing protein [Phyllobacterium sp. CL33Tsu]